MRLLFAVLTLSLLFSSCRNYTGDNEKDEAIPVQVREKFQLEYPNAQNTSWTDTSRYYTVDFLHMGAQKRLTYDRNARLLTAESELPLAELHPEIIKFAGNNYPKYQITKAIKKDRRDGTFFLVKIKKDKESLKLKFNAQGGFVNTVTVKKGNQN